MTKEEARTLLALGIGFGAAAAVVVAAVGIVNAFTGVFGGQGYTVFFVVGGAARTRIVRPYGACAPTFAQ